MDVEIREFDPESIAVDATILIVGKRHTGKSTLTRDIMWSMRKKLDLIVGMNPTEMGNHALGHFTPPAFVFHEFNDKKLHHILDWQRRCVANDKAMRVGFLMDDCMAETTGTGSKKKKVMGSQDIVKVFKLGRHLKLFYINAMQYIKDAPPEIRGQVDLLFAFNTTSSSEKEKLFKEYFAMFKNYKDFCKVFDECAQGYDCIVLDTRRAAVSPGDCIFYYRAKLHPEPFHVGREAFWNLSTYYYADHSDYSMDATKVLGFSTGAPINVPPANANSNDIRIVKKPRDEAVAAEQVTHV